MKKYPHEFYRAISDNADNFDNNGYLTKAPFQFNKNDSRKDEYEEMSINWNDSPKSLKILMECKNKKGITLASYGYVCVPRTLLLNKFQDLIRSSELNFERSPIFGNFIKGIKRNKFHGNILFKTKTAKKYKVALQEALANYSNSCIVTREDYLKSLKD